MLVHLWKTESIGSLGNNGHNMMQRLQGKLLQPIDNNRQTFLFPLQVPGVEGTRGNELQVHPIIAVGQTKLENPT